ncbi:MAG: HTH cro/C1-type domain-containing protein [uncultured Clostridium sp.]
MPINERIKQLRKELGLSQAKFAKEISISNGYIASIELGHRAVNERIIKLICSTFNVREEWLKHGFGNIFENEQNHTTELAINTFKELTPEFQEYVLKQIKELLKLQNKSNESD